MTITTLVEAGKIFTGMGDITRHGIGTCKETVCLGTAEVNIAVAIGRLVAPRQAIAVFGIVLGMLPVMIKPVEDTLCKGYDLSIAALIIQYSNLTFHGNDEGIHAVDTAGCIQLTDCLVDFRHTFLRLSQVSHHHSDLCLRTPLLRLLSLKTTDLDLLRRPLHIAFKVDLGTTGDHQQVENNSCLQIRMAESCRCLRSDLL